MLPAQYSRIGNTASVETQQPLTSKTQSRCHLPFDIKTTVILDVTPCGLVDKHQKYQICYSDFNHLCFLSSRSNQIRAIASLKAVKVTVSL